MVSIFAFADITKKGIVNTNKGEARVIKNAICIHEEDYGVLWKHTNWRTGEASTARFTSSYYFLYLLKDAED